MKLVQVKIICRSREEYERLISRLGDLFMSHRAIYDAPCTWTAVIRHAHIQAEILLDRLIDEMKIETVSKTPVSELTDIPYIPPHLTRIAA